MIGESGHLVIARPGLQVIGNAKNQVATSKAAGQAILASAWAARSEVRGRNTLKQVPLRPVSVLERNSIRPPCFSTICFVTQRPSPVPTSLLVVKNGSKIFSWLPD